MSADDPFKLNELFAGGEAWLPLLKPVLEAQPELADYLGPTRDKSIVPVRELTFQALKPNPPEAWKVVVFGQNPYPRVESATGIAMFDNQFNAWSDSRFGAVTSIRCIVKAACMWKHGVPKATSVAEIRALLAKQAVVAPPEWFQAVLTQGVLLMNAALTASSGAERTPAQHTAFWRPVVEKTAEAILQAKQRATSPEARGVVFAWWGAHAKSLRKAVEKLQPKYPDVKVTHLDHCNPAAQGDAFCSSDHFGAINAALEALGITPIDWLPTAGWKDRLPKQETAEKMGAFISHTMELHRLYLERLGDAVQETLEELAAIEGVSTAPLLELSAATAPIAAVLQGLAPVVGGALAYAKKTAAAQLSADEIAALHLYTMESALYRELNAALRAPDRARVKPYILYLRLFLSALERLQPTAQSL
jgi:uracil DNA glycosylase